MANISFPSSVVSLATKEFHGADKFFEKSSLRDRSTLRRRFKGED
jgi:hypothetical protein